MFSSYLVSQLIERGSRMTRYSFFIALGAVLIASNLPNASSAAVPGDNGALRTVSTTLNQFAVDFYKNTSEGQPDNLICSPVSVSMVLSMAAFGAGGETAKEMRSALHLPADDAVTKNGFASLIDILNNVKDVKLQLANKIFTASGFQVKPAFTEVTTNSFKSPAQTLDFGNAAASSAAINAWCSGKTNGLIKEVIKPDDLNGAAMVLVNAVYFKGKWADPFEKSLTSPKPFYINAKTTRDVPMMHNHKDYNYGTLQALDARYVELPYEHEDPNDATSMFIILPNTPGGLKAAEKKLHTVNFQQLHKDGRLTNMNLYLPKFKIESSLDLASTLEKMGMRLMFSDSANFTGIADSPPLKISKVLQKAVIEVNEEGSEAAAITALFIQARAGHALVDPPINLTIDKPFVYAIVHKETNTILFQGHITKPVY